jgi:hypothetical protein
LATERVINLSVSVPLPIKNWWMFYANFNAFNAHYDADFGDGKTISRGVFTVNFYGQNTFTLPKGWTVEISGWYNSPGVWGGTFATNALGSLDLGVQKKSSKNKER